jgi:outer membrane protein assembly factor BamA
LLYNLNTVNASWGYEFQWKNKFLSVRIPNIEYSFLVKRDSLDKLIMNNPSLKSVFTDGFVFSTITSYTVIGGKNNNTNVFRFNAEASGLLLGLLRNRFLDTNLYRFIKVDAEFARKIQIRKTSVVLRLFAGVGYELGSTKHPDKRNNLPFFKQYFAGGPNSMRAWRLRQLGPGSVKKEFSGSLGTPDRYGDVQLEGNIEYRFPITKIGGVRLNGALFTDIGNIWFLKSAAGLPEEVFSFSRLGKDIAVGIGGGLRVDFGFFVVRLDYAYKAKNPSPAPADSASQNKWFYDWKPLNGQLQLGINYPFISDLFTK